MKCEHRGTTIELIRVGIHHPNWPDKVPEEARDIWEIVIDGKKNSGTNSGDREEVLGKMEKIC